MKRTSYLILCAFLCVGTLSAQIKLKGRVIDHTNLEPLPFATIGVKDRSLGSVADEQGNFSFEIPTDSAGQNDSVIISSIGYQSIKLSIKEMENRFDVLRLKPSTVILNEITIKPGKFKTKTFGRTSRSAFMSTKMISERNHISDELGKEIGTVIDIDENCQLNDFNMFVIFNHFKLIKFRLNIYSVKDNLPDELLINDNITFDVSGGRQIPVNIDLKKYNIYLNDRDKIAVTVQWLKSELGDNLKRSFNVAAMHSSKNTILFRNKSQSQWQEVNGRLSFYVTADCFMHQ